MLKYKFIAQYNDGTLFEQNDEDTSSKDSLRSAYYDVDQEKLTGFALCGDHLYAVDLIDGHFEIDGVPFKSCDVPVENRRLIFFRRHTHAFESESMHVIDHTITYHLGWQGNDSTSGKNIQHVIIIS